MKDREHTIQAGPWMEWGTVLSQLRTLAAYSIHLNKWMIHLSHLALDTTETKARATRPKEMTTVILAPSLILHLHL